MKRSNQSAEEFARCMCNRVSTMADRAIAFLYYYAVVHASGATLKQLISDFEEAGLSSPNITKLKNSLKKDKRTVMIAGDAWRIISDKVIEVGKVFSLDECLKERKPLIKKNPGTFIDEKRFREIKKKKGVFDFTRLIQMLSEVDDAFSRGNYISVAFLIRAILDHVPPIFELGTFTEVANNYGSRSFKEAMAHLDISSRKIADAYLHTHIRLKETSPNKTQVNFSQALDLLLSEIIRIS